jgi:hypothetical protein
VIRHALILVILLGPWQLSANAQLPRLPPRAGPQGAVDCDRLLGEPDYRPEHVVGPMRFFMPERNACLGNAVNNPYLAVGTITNTTPAAFAEFAAKNPPYAPIEFTSPGGNLLAALRLGEQIRSGGYDTSLGEVCASACAYAMMGGVNRYVAQQSFDADADYDNRNAGASGTKFGIHQFYQSEALDEPQRKAFSAIDKSSDQVIMGVLLEYVLRMGGDVRLVSVASKIPPWQEMRWLTQDEMIAWKVDNTHRLYTDLAFRAFGRTGSYVEVTSAKGPAQSYLRMFCKTKYKEPIFTFITDQLVQSVALTTKVVEISKATQRVKNLLTQLNIRLELGPDKRTGAFQVEDLQGFLQDSGSVRVYAALRPIGLGRQEAERLTRVALQDSGDLPRSEWTFQDSVKFNINGDRKLIGLAMRNCVE